MTLAFLEYDIGTIHIRTWRFGTTIDEEGTTANITAFNRLNALSRGACLPQSLITIRFAVIVGSPRPVLK